MKQYTVTFNPVNGDAVYSIHVEENAKLEDPGDPYKRAADFLGWYLGSARWDFENDMVTSDMTLTAKWAFGEDFFVRDANAAARAKGANVRVMSFNILASEWSNKIDSIDDRKELMVQTVLDYAPDVVGLQENNQLWYDYQKDNFGPYVLVNADNNKIRDDVNYSTVAYNSDTVRLIEYGQRALTVRYNNHCRNVTWAIFERKTAPYNRFIVTSTHWELTPERRVLNAQETALIFKELQKKYNLPMFCTGDYNCRENSREYAAFMSLSKFQDTKLTAVTRGLICNSTHLGDGTGTREDFDSGYWLLGPVSYPLKYLNKADSIDHIFCTQNVKALYYDTVVDEGALFASDHCPVYVDAQIGV